MRRTELSFDVGVVSCNVRYSVWISRAVWRKDIEAVWICEVQFLVEFDIDVEMRGSVTVELLLGEAGLDPFCCDWEASKEIFFFGWASRVGEEALSCVKSKASARGWFFIGL